MFWSFQRWIEHFFNVELSISVNRQSSVYLTFLTLGTAFLVFSSFASASDRFGVGCNTSDIIANDVAVSWLQRAFARDNRQRAFGCITVRCSSLAIRQFRQCTRWFQHRMQHHLASPFIANDVAGNGHSLLYQTIASVHLTVLQSGAAAWQSDNRQCIWLHSGRMQHLWHQITASASDGIGIGCSSDYFFKSVISTPTKTTFIPYAAYATSAKGLRNRDSQSTSKHVFYILANDYFNVSANDHFNVSINGHFERSLHAVKTDQSSISFHFIYDQFFNFSILFSFFFKFSNRNSAEWPLICLSKRELRIKLKTSKKKNHKRWKQTINQNIKNQKIKMKFHATNEISEYSDLMKNDEFFSLSKWCQYWYNLKFIFITCDLYLNEHTAQMYILIDIINFDHMIHKSGHIKTV